MTSQTPKSSFFGSVGTVFAAQLLAGLAQFFITKVILSSLSVHDAGVFFGLQRWSDFFSALFIEMGLSNIIMREIAKAPDQVPTLISTYARVRLYSWLLTTATVGAGTVLFDAELSPVVVFLFISLGFAGRTVMLRSVFDSRYRARAQMAMPSLMVILDTVLHLGLLYFYPYQHTLISISALSAVAMIPGFVLLAITSGELPHLRIPFSAPLAKRLLREAAPVLGVTLLLQLQDKLDVLTLTLLSTEYEMGLYGAAFRITMPMNMLMFSILSGAFPKIISYSQQGSAEADEFLSTFARWLTFLSLLPCVAMVPFMPDIISLMSKAEYLAGVQIFNAALWVIPHSFLVQLILFVAVAWGRQRDNLVVATALLIVGSVAGLILAPDYGGLGVAVSKIISHFLAGGIIGVYLLMSLGSKKGWLPLALRLNAAIATVGISQWFIVRALPPIAAVCVSFVILLFCAGVFGLLKPADLHPLQPVLERLRRKR